MTDSGKFSQLVRTASYPRWRPYRWHRIISGPCKSCSMNWDRRSWKKGRIRIVGTLNQMRKILTILFIKIFENVLKKG